MGEDSFKGLLFAFILFALFGFLTLRVIIDQAALYGKDTTELFGESFDIEKFNSSVSPIKETSENLRERFEKQNIFSIVAGVIVEGIFDIGKTMVLMISTPITLLNTILTNVLHIPQIVTNVILGLVILSTIFGIWALIKIGN